MPETMSFTDGVRMPFKISFLPPDDGRRRRRISLRIMTRMLSVATALLLLLAVSAPAVAQQVTVDVTLPSYDYVNLSDVMDVSPAEAEYQLRSTFDRFAVQVDDADYSGTPRKVYAQAAVVVDFARECGHVGAYPRTISVVESNVFEISGGSRTLTAYDFTEGDLSGELIAEDTQLTDCLKNALLEQGRTTAPVGVYGVAVRVYPVDAAGEKVLPVTDGATDCNAGGNWLACDIATLTVSYTSREQVVVDLAYPPDGSFVQSEFPTFSWAVGVDEVELNVFEVPEGMGPREVLDNTSHQVLKVPLTGASAFTYPATPPAGADVFRPLEDNTTYVWYVDAKLTASSGSEVKASLPWTFTVDQTGSFDASSMLTTEQQQAMRSVLEQVVQQYPQLSALRNMKIDLMMEGTRPLTFEQFQARIKRLVKDGTSLTIRVQDL